MDPIQAPRGYALLATAVAITAAALCYCYIGEAPGAAAGLGGPAAPCYTALERSPWPEEGLDLRRVFNQGGAAADTGGGRAGAGRPQPRVYSGGPATIWPAASWTFESLAALHGPAHASGAGAGGAGLLLSDVYVNVPTQVWCCRRRVWVWGWGWGWVGAAVFRTWYNPAVACLPCTSRVPVPRYRCQSVLTSQPRPRPRGPPCATDQA